MEHKKVRETKNAWLQGFQKASENKLPDAQPRAQQLELSGESVLELLTKISVTEKRLATLRGCIVSW